MSTTTKTIIVTEKVLVSQFDEKYLVPIADIHIPPYVSLEEAAAIREEIAAERRASKKIRQLQRNADRSRKYK
jgi:hypothetical protein